MMFSLRTLSPFKTWLFFSILIITFTIPTFLLLDPRLVWDDHIYLAHYFKNPIDQSWRPFGFGGTIYWRPLATLTMFIPMHWIVQMGGEAIFMLMSKATSIVLLMTAGIVALKFILMHEKAHNHLALLAIAACVAAHPIFAEPTMWFSDRYDLMLCVILPWLLIRTFDLSVQRSFFEGVAFSIALCLTKESGFFWCLSGGLMLYKASALNRKFSIGLIVGALFLLYLRFVVIYSCRPAMYEAQLISESQHWSLVLLFKNLGIQFQFMLTPFMDPGPIHLHDQFPLAFSLGCCFMAITLLLNWKSIQSRNSSTLHWGWAAVSMNVLVLQTIFTSYIDDDVTLPATWVRYAAPSFMVLLCVVGRLAMLQSKNSATLLIIFVTIASLPVATFSKNAFASELDLWGAVYKTSPNASSAYQYCLQLRAFGQPERASQVGEAWRMTHLDRDNRKIEKACHG